MEQVSLKDPQQEDRYRNRRAMAWIGFLYCLAMGGALTFIGLFVDGAAEHLQMLGFLLSVVFAVPATVVLTYFGVTALTDIKGFKT